LSIYERKILQKEIKMAEKQQEQQGVDTQYIISGSQVQSILRYLFTRPYGEVVQGIEVLSKGLKQLDPKIGADFVAKPTDAKK
jgi:uroporphyrinogen-III synthase